MNFIIEIDEEITKLKKKITEKYFLFFFFEYFDGTEN